MKAETFFSSEEKDKITAMIKTVEQQTAGEVAVMVVDRSDTYPEAGILLGCVSGSLAALLITDFIFAASLWIFMPLAFALSLLICQAARFMPLLLIRLFIARDRLEQKVHEQALRAFYDKELYRTRDETGVLFFLSLFERKVWVLADKGIYSRISRDALQAYAENVAQGVKTGNAADALCREIENVGIILAEHFPRRPDDINELTDKVITD